MKSKIYCMVQNLTGEIFDEWVSGKFWRKSFDEFYNVNADLLATSVAGEIDGEKQHGHL